MQATTADDWNGNCFAFSGGFEVRLETRSSPERATENSEATMRRTLEILAVAGILLMANVAWAGKAPAVNVNTAKAEQLMLLPRIGKVMAQRIIDQRKAEKFKRVEDLEKVKGIGPKSIQNLRPFVRVTGRTTLTKKVRCPKGKCTVRE